MEENIRFHSNHHLDAVLHGYPIGCNGVQLIGTFINVIGTMNCRVEDVPRDVESLMKTEPALS